VRWESWLKSSSSFPIRIATPHNKCFPNLRSFEGCGSWRRVHGKIRNTDAFSFGISEMKKSLASVKLKWISKKQDVRF
jgi:hypothetical protein